jgi:hypothetical protein
MAGPQEAVDTLKALARHADLILDAHLNQQGSLEKTEDNAYAIKALKSLRLLWQLEDEEQYQLSQVVTQLLDHSLRNYRRHMADEQIHSLWERLNQHLLVQYQHAKRRQLHKDQTRIAKELQECLYDLIEQLKQATLNFSYYITGGFTYITDLELRLKENERVLSRAHKMNVVLDSFHLDELEQIAGQDPLLRRLLLKHLPEVLSKCREQMVDTLHKLNALLVRLKKNVETSRLIAAFEAKYEETPGWQPDIENCQKPPTPLLLATPISLKAYANLNDVRHEAWLSGLTANLHPPQKASTAETEQPLILEDTSTLEPIAAENNRLITATEILLNEIQAQQLSIHASEAYQLLDLDCEIDHWLLSLMNAYTSLNSELRQQIRFEFLEDPDNHYTDQFWTRDILISAMTAATL